MAFNIEDNRAEVHAALNSAVMRALERSGLLVEGEAKENLEHNHSVDTGNLVNSVAHKVVDGEQTVYVGTPVEYGVYVELGTGKYATTGGRPTPWVYQDSKGNWHHTHGQRAKPFLKPAITDSVNSIRNIIKDELENA